MFYSTQILAKKGPLGMVWLAAHMDSRLKRKNVFTTDIEGSVDSIMNPEAPLALRLSGQLLLGVVKIYNKKIIYLVEDCHETLTKLEQAFNPGAVGLSDADKANLKKLTMPDNFRMPDNYNPFQAFEDDLDLGAVDLSQPIQFALNSREGSRHLTVDDELGLQVSPLPFQEEKFDVSGEEMELHWSNVTPEELRQMPLMQPTYGPQEDSPQNNKEDRYLPHAAQEDIVSDTAAPPSGQRSSHSDPDQYHNLFTNDDVPAFDDGFQAPALEVQPDSDRKEGGRGKEGGGDRAPAKLVAGGKRKPLKRDIDKDGNLATMISTSSIRALHGDRKSILQERTAGDKGFLLSNQNPRLDGLAAGSRKTAADSLLKHPGLVDVVCGAPALRNLFSSPKSATGLEERAASEGNQLVEAGDGGNCDMEDSCMPNSANQDENLSAALGGVMPSTGGEEMLNTELSHDMPPVMDLHDQLPDMPSASPLASVHPGDSSGGTILSPGSRRPSSASKRSKLDHKEWEEDEDEDEGPVGNFPARTQRVLKQVKAKASGLSGRKRVRLDGAATTTVGFQELHRGGRAEAARLFFDLLVLQSRKEVNLSQEKPYSEIAISLSKSRA